MKNQTLLEKIRDLLPSLTKQQKKAAAYMLDHYKKVAFMTSSELALKSEASAATINRLCLTLGFNGYSDFQNELQDLIQTELTALDRLNGSAAGNNTLKEIFETEAEALKNSLKRLSLADYLAAVDLMAAKRRLYVVGHQASEPVAVYAAYCLGKVKAGVERFDIGELDAPGKLTTLTTEDAALVFCMPRYPIKTLEAMEVLRSLGVPIIMVTHSPLSEYTDRAAAVLSVSVKYHRFTDGLSPLISLVNAIAVDLYDRNDVAGKKNLEAFERVTPYLFRQPGYTGTKG